MSEEQLKAFLEAVKSDAELQGKLKAAADADAVVAIAKAAGFVISADELKKSQAKISDEELEGVAEISDEELKGVAGGGATPSIPPDAPPPRRQFNPIVTIFD